MKHEPAYFSEALWELGQILPGLAGMRLVPEDTQPEPGDRAGARKAVGLVLAQQVVVRRLTFTILPGTTLFIWWACCPRQYFSRLSIEFDQQN